VEVFKIFVIYQNLLKLLKTDNSNIKKYVPGWMDGYRRLDGWKI
jgi:hypothetical protein